MSSGEADECLYTGGPLPLGVPLELTRRLDATCALMEAQASSTSVLSVVTLAEKATTSTTPEIAKRARGRGVRLRMIEPVLAIGAPAESHRLP